MGRLFEVAFALFDMRSRKDGEIGGVDVEKPSEADEGSFIISRESIHVGELFSSKYKAMHQVPSRVPDGLLLCAIANSSFHIRAANGHSFQISRRA